MVDTILVNWSCFFSNHNAFSWRPQIIIMRNIYLPPKNAYSDEERNILYDMMVDDKESAYRAKIILLKDKGYAVPKIRREQL